MESELKLVVDNVEKHLNVHELRHLFGIYMTSDLFKDKYAKIDYVIIKDKRLVKKGLSSVRGYYSTPF